MDQEMSLEQAFKNVENVFSNVNGNKRTHLILEKTLQVLKSNIKPVGDNGLRENKES